MAGSRQEREVERIAWLSHGGCLQMLCNRCVEIKAESISQRSKQTAEQVAWRSDGGNQLAMVAASETMWLHPIPHTGSGVVK